MLKNWYIRLLVFILIVLDAKAVRDIVQGEPNLGAKYMMIAISIAVFGVMYLIGQDNLRRKILK